MVKLSPIKGIDTMLLHYDSEKGWLFEFWMGRKFGAAERYVVTKDFTIYGVFTTISMVKQLTAEEYWLDNKKTEEEAIAYVAENINLGIGKQPCRISSYSVCGVGYLNIAGLQNCV